MATQALLTAGTALYKPPNGTKVLQVKLRLWNSLTIMASKP